MKLAFLVPLLVMAGEVQGQQQRSVLVQEPTPAVQPVPDQGNTTTTPRNVERNVVRVMAQVTMPPGPVQPQPTAVVHVARPAWAYMPTARWGFFGRRIIVTPRWVPGTVYRPAQVTGPYYFLR